MWHLPSWICCQIPSRSKQPPSRCKRDDLSWQGVLEIWNIHSLSEVWRPLEGGKMLAWWNLLTREKEELLVRPQYHQTEEKEHFELLQSNLNVWISLRSTCHIGFQCNVQAVSYLFITIYKLLSYSILYLYNNYTLLVSLA